jgi:serine phosphatase RsbU (regulator of sigma subunit)
MNSVSRKLSISWSHSDANPQGDIRLVSPNTISVTEDLTEAGRFQQSFLPPPTANNDAFSVETIYYPLGDLGGDFIDYSEHPDGSLSGYLLDVTGHNIASAMQAFSLRTLFRQAAELTPKLHEQLTWINEELWREKAEPLPAAALLFHLRPADGILQYAAAGIGPFYHDDGGYFHKIDTAGFLLGAFKDSQFYSCFLKIKPQQTLLFLTDGFSEKVTPYKLYTQGAMNCLKQGEDSCMLTDDASAIIIKLF